MDRNNFNTGVENAIFEGLTSKSCFIDRHRDRSSNRRSGHDETGLRTFWGFIRTNVANSYCCRCITAKKEIEILKNYRIVITPFIFRLLQAAHPPRHPH